ncbi:MAG: hypothetical protein PHF11_07890, partial [Candidatus Omnitrophica bacterium]|nr:hypothetical protein [Candidatus Omnitrophota bacterium]
VILGILATLGFTQYTKIVEKGRQAEARAVISTARKNVIAYYLQNGTIATITQADAGIGTGNIPLSPQFSGTCDTNHYWGYYVWLPWSQQYTSYVLVATRCSSGGKPPQGDAGHNLAYVDDVAGNTPPPGRFGWYEADTWAARGY